MHYKEPFCHTLKLKEYKKYRGVDAEYDGKIYSKLTDTNVEWDEPTNEDIEFMNKIDYNKKILQSEIIGIRFAIIISVFIIIAGGISIYDRQIIDIVFCFISLCLFVAFGLFAVSRYKAAKKTISSLQNNNYKVIHGTVAKIMAMDSADDITYIFFVDFPSEVHRQIVFNSLHVNELVPISEQDRKITIVYVDNKYIYTCGTNSEK